VPLFLEIRVPEFEFLYNTVYDMSKEASLPKASLIRPAFLIQLRLVTDAQTEELRRRTPANSALAQRSVARVKRAVVGCSRHGTGSVTKHTR